jgi:hypothetical protein
LLSKGINRRRTDTQQKSDTKPKGVLLGKTLHHFFSLFGVCGQAS